jgi:hypothetical protein
VIDCQPEIRRSNIQSSTVTYSWTPKTVEKRHPLRANNPRRKRRPDTVLISTPSGVKHESCPLIRCATRPTFGAGLLYAYSTVAERPSDAPGGLGSGVREGNPMLYCAAPGLVLGSIPDVTISVSELCYRPN